MRLAAAGVALAIAVTLTACSPQAGAPSVPTPSTEAGSPSVAVEATAEPSAVSDLEAAWTREQLKDACVSTRDESDPTTWQSAEDADISFEGDHWDVYVEGNNPNLSTEINDGIPCAVAGTPEAPQVTLYH